jgi:hypothetical protein
MSKAKHLLDYFPANTAIYESENGWMTTQIFHSVWKDVIIPWIDKDVRADDLDEWQIFPMDWPKVSNACSVRCHCMLTLWPTGARHLP